MSEIRLGELNGDRTWGNYKFDGITLIRALWCMDNKPKNRRHEGPTARGTSSSILFMQAQWIFILNVECSTTACPLQVVEKFDTKVWNATVMLEAVGFSEMLEVCIRNSTAQLSRSLYSSKRNSSFSYNLKFLYENHCTWRGITKYYQMKIWSRSRITYRWVKCNSKSEVSFHSSSFQSLDSALHKLLFPLL